MGETWPTPQEFDSREFVRDPETREAMKQRPSSKNAGGRNLKDEAPYWPNPEEAA